VKVTRAVAGTITVLALAGAVATAALIFAVGLTVLWPVLIAGACLAVVGVVALVVAHHIIQNKMLIVVKDYVTFLKKMKKTTPVLDALKKLKEEHGAPISDGDITDICTCVQYIMSRKTGSWAELLTLSDFKSAKTEAFTTVCFLELENLSKSLPVFMAVLSLIANSRFVCRANIANSFFIEDLPSDEKYISQVKDQATLIIYTVINYGNLDPAAADQRNTTQSAMDILGKNRVFVSHYDGNGKLVIDP
jgi:hypothetical protein